MGLAWCLKMLNNKLSLKKQKHVFSSPILAKKNSTGCKSSGYDGRSLGFQSWLCVYSYKASGKRCYLSKAQFLYLLKGDNSIHLRMVVRINQDTACDPSGTWQTPSKDELLLFASL